MLGGVAKPSGQEYAFIHSLWRRMRLASRQLSVKVELGQFRSPRCENIDMSDRMSSAQLRSTEYNAEM